MMEKWGNNYCLIGPYFAHKATAEFEEIQQYDDPFGQAVLKLKEQGYDVRYGYWLVSGRPKVVLINPFSIYHKLGELKYLLWEHHGIGTPGEDDLINQVVAFRP
jgi:glycogen(starch) synthase